jgi:MFS family permease
MGARQAFSVSLVRDRRRGLASSLNTVSWNVPAALGPALGGWLIGAGALFWPFVLAAALQFGYVALFPAVMGRYERRPTGARRPA